MAASCTCPMQTPPLRYLIDSAEIVGRIKYYANAHTHTCNADCSWGSSIYTEEYMRDCLKFCIVWCTPKGNHARAHLVLYFFVMPGFRKQIQLSVRGSRIWWERGVRAYLNWDRHTQTHTHTYARKCSDKRLFGWLNRMIRFDVFI